MTKFDVCRPAAFEIEFRADRAIDVATAIRDGGYVDEAEAVEIQEGGFGQVRVTIRATNERDAQRRLERALGKVGEWVDRSEGAFGEAGIMIFVPR